MHSPQYLGDEKRDKHGLEQARKLIIQAQAVRQDNPRVDAQGDRDRRQAKEEDGDRDEATRAASVDVGTHHAVMREEKSLVTTAATWRA
ncbi:hypothetical protein ACJZ2D_005436 [Fusarium nematophilum]